MLFIQLLRPRQNMIFLCVSVCECVCVCVFAFPESFTNCTFCCALSGWPTEYFLITITTIGEVQRDIICSCSAHAKFQPKYSFISLAGGKIARKRQ